MTRRLLPPLAALLLLLAAAPAAPNGSQPTAASRTLAAILDEHWQHRLATQPFLGLRHGRPVEALPDLSFAGAERDAAFARSLLARLAAVDPAGLAHEEWLSREILLWESRLAVESLPFYWHQFLVTPYSWSFAASPLQFQQLPLAEEADRARYLKVLAEYPRQIEQARAHLRRQGELGVRLPREELDLVAPMFASYLRPPAEGPFALAPERLAGVEPAAAAAFRARVEALVAGEILPALTALAGDLEAARAGAPETVGLGQYPWGESAYRYLVRAHTTLDLAPEEIHALGLSEVERLTARMAELRRELGVPGDTRAAHATIRKDPRFLAKTPEEVGERLMRPVRAIEPLVGRWFGRQPRAPYGVRRLDPALEGALTFGYYEQPTPTRPRGDYLYNASRLEERPLVNAAALIYHELVPGHHFQIALQHENQALPPSRREPGYTAFVEGWAEYASELGIEMGLYRDPWDLYGRLSMDLFLSSRLVVDTGMNLHRWPRQRAIDYLLDHLLESPTQLATETLRYSVDMPGQALAYKMGSAKFWELRRRAERALGPRFDLARFHDAVLGSGAMPLAVLEKHVDWWIEEERRR
ncbi:MAG TPA: DUF885 domain-containing protein [Thermoanaerobaculia bacterium]|nr:DUF885 domain-containing protein [Thermoanaerobaculia bacterium]